MHASALRWSQCISARSRVSLVVGRGNNSAAGSGPAEPGCADADADADADALGAAPAAVFAAELTGVDRGAAGKPPTDEPCVAICASERRGGDTLAVGPGAGASLEPNKAARVPPVPPTTM